MPLDEGAGRLRVKFDFDVGAYNTTFEQKLRQDIYNIPLPATASIIDYDSPGQDPPNQGWATFDLQAEDPRQVTGISLELATIIRQYQDVPPAGERLPQP